MINITFAPAQEELSEHLELALRNCVVSLIRTRLESQFAGELDDLLVRVHGNWTQGDFLLTVRGGQHKDVAATVERALEDAPDERPRLQYSVA